jgi:hypothetical protein
LMQVSMDGAGILGHLPGNGLVLSVHATWPSFPSRLGQALAQKCVQLNAS